MAAAQTTIPRTQGERTEHVYQQQTQVQFYKTDPDVVKFMKDVESELGAIRTLILKFEAQLMNMTRKRKQDDCRGKQGPTPDLRKARLIKVRRGRQHSVPPR